MGNDCELDRIKTHPGLGGIVVHLARTPLYAEPLSKAPQAKLIKKTFSYFRLSRQNEIPGRGGRHEQRTSFSWQPLFERVREGYIGAIPLGVSGWWP